MDLTHLAVAVVAGVVASLLLRPLVVRFVVAPRVRRLAAQSRLECGLRVASGEVPGLTARWRHGTAQLDGRTLRLRPGVLGGRWVAPGTREVALVVDEVVGERSPARREVLTVARECRILRVRAGDAEVEWAVLPSQVDRVREQVGS